MCPRRFEIQGWNQPLMKSTAYLTEASSTMVPWSESEHDLVSALFTANCPSHPSRIQIRVTVFLTVLYRHSFSTEEDAARNYRC